MCEENKTRNIQMNTQSPFDLYLKIRYNLDPTAFPTDNGKALGWRLKYILDIYVLKRETL